MHSLELEELTIAIVHFIDGFEQADMVFFKCIDCGSKCFYVKREARCEELFIRIFTRMMNTSENLKNPNYYQQEARP